MACDERLAKLPRHNSKGVRQFRPKRFAVQRWRPHALTALLGEQTTQVARGGSEERVPGARAQEKKAEEKKAMQANAGAASSEQPTPAIAGSAASSSTHMTWREFSNNCRQNDGWWKCPCCGTLVIDEDELANHAWDSRGQGHPDATVQLAWCEGP